MLIHVHICISDGMQIIQRKQNSINKHTHIYIYIHTRQLSEFQHAGMWHARVCVCICIYVCTHVCISMYVCMHECMYACMCVSLDAYHKHMYIYIYLKFNKQANFLGFLRNAQKYIWIESY